MNSFLESIATVYYEHEKNNLDRYCFIFPNKRSGTFFQHYLHECNKGKSTIIEPEITTISEFISNFSESVEADRYDLLFTLYNEYKKLTEEIEDFDKFVFWGDILIGDFNDVDRYMADPHRIFKNITDVREISTDFLTDEQKEIIKKYWGVELPKSDPEEFWKHITKDGKSRKNRDSFVKLWEILDQLYNNFKSELSRNGLCFSGMQYREVADKLKKATRDDIPYDRVIFVGFNVLSTSEIKIFECLKNLGIADYYWDYNLPDDIKEISTATHFIKKYIKLFPSIYKDEVTLEVPELPEISVMNIPSNVGQVKMTGKILQDMLKDGRISDADNAIDTAIVLPSEDLFIDLLHSIPKDFSKVNITMGYPLRLTPVATFLHNVITLHMRARSIQGVWYFFYEDVKSIITHPIINAFASKACNDLKNEMEQLRMFNISVHYIAENYPELAPVFYPVSNLQSSEEVFPYIERLIDYIISNNEKVGAIQPNSPDYGFLIRYQQSVSKLKDATIKYGITLRESTLFHLIERTVNSESVNFIGEPLAGLQIMGVLETRALDFDNIIMLSMNERIFPRRHYSRSFIPNNIRRCYGLSTTEFQECIYSYYFFRLISRASHVSLIYDGRTTGIKGGEMSRYIYQLIYIYASRKLTRIQAKFTTPSIAAKNTISITKSDEIMKKVNMFLSDATEKRYLSATSINEFLSCPLKFYFKYIERTKTEEEINDYMDESVFGQIVHKVLELVYSEYKGTEITSDILKQLATKSGDINIKLEKHITATINKIYKKLPSNNGENLTPLTGEADILGKLIKEIVIYMFQCEMEFNKRPFKFEDAEMEIKTSLKFDDNREFNITGVIDRVDEIGNNTKRLIDYKTGADEVSISGIEDITTDEPNRPHSKAILQLFLYGEMYKKHQHFTGNIMPIIYNIKRIAKEGLKPITIGKQELDGNLYANIHDEVIQNFNSRISALFDKDKPFEPTPSSKACKFCDFKDICEQSVE